MNLSDYNPDDLGDLHDFVDQFQFPTTKGLCDLYLEQRHNLVLVENQYESLFKACDLYAASNQSIKLFYTLTEIWNLYRRDFEEIAADEDNDETQAILQLINY